MFYLIKYKVNINFFKIAKLKARMKIYSIKYLKIIPINKRYNFYLYKYFI